MVTKRMTEILSGLVLMVFCVGPVLATEFRSPLIVERGPMRYVEFGEEWETNDYSLKTWTAGYSREASKAFLSHGMNTHQLSALFFGKSDFRMSEIFPNSYADPTTEYYNPFLGVTVLHPRVTYVERGMSIGARIAFPVNGNKGRVGLRAQIPIRKIEIEREDAGDKDTNQLDDLLTGDIVTLYADGATSEDYNTPNTGDAKDVYARAIRLDFLESLYYNAKRESFIDYSTTGDVRMIGLPVNNTQIAGDRRGAIIYVPEGTIPRLPDYKLGIHQGFGATTATVNELPLDGDVTDIA